MRIMRIRGSTMRSREGGWSGNRISGPKSSLGLLQILSHSTAGSEVREPEDPAAASAQGDTERGEAGKSTAPREY